MRVRTGRNLRLSLGALWAHRLRAALAVGSTAVGVAGVLVLSAIGSGARARVLGEIALLGDRLLVISVAPQDVRARRLRGGAGGVRRMTVADGEALLRGSTAIARVAPAVDGNRIARVGPRRNPTTVLGTTPAWLEIRRFPMAEGRFFTASENAARARVAVLGADARASLFADSLDPIGRIIRIGAVPFEVVGVLVARGMSASGTATEDDRVIIPLETALHRVFGAEDPRVLYVEAASVAALERASAEAAAILRERHDVPRGAPDDFVIDHQRALLDVQLRAQTSFRRLLTGLGLLSLIVGGVGILSILLLAVRERRAEIGLRVAVGAHPRDLLTQFLAEALLLAGAGTAAGLALGTALSELVSSATRWDAHVTPALVLLAVTSALVVGGGAGVLPAWRAARMDPVEALRAE